MEVNVTLLTLALIGHYVGDFVLQTSWMALNKSKQFAPLVLHICVYTLTLAVTTGYTSGIVKHEDLCDRPR